MGYEISYGPKYPGKKKGPGWLFLILIVLLALAVGAKTLWPEGADKLRQVILPLSSSDQAAFAQMIEDVRDGENLADAVTVFCQAVLANAEMADGS